MLRQDIPKSALVQGLGLNTLPKSYSDPKQRHRYVRVGTKRKGRETPKGTPTLNAEAQLSSASFHLEPKGIGKLHSQITTHGETSCFHNSPLLTWSGDELQEAITWICFHPLLIPYTVH